VAYAPQPLKSIKMGFVFSDPSPVVLAQLLPGYTISRVTLLIKIPFDDPSATILMGTSAAPGLFLGTQDSTPTRVDQYNSELIHNITLADILLLTINPLASTQGAGILYYELGTQ
jgi:hypothetical protein